MSRSMAAPLLRNPSVVAWLRLARVFTKIERRASEHLRGYGLSHGQFDILTHVAVTPDISQQALADALLVTKGNVCQLLDKMEAADLLIRRQDGRTNHLTLTDRGRELYAVLAPEHEALIAEQLSAVAPEDQVQFLRTLRTLDRALPG